MGTSTDTLAEMPEGYAMPPLTILEPLPETTQAWRDEEGRRVMITTTDTSYFDMTTGDDSESTLDETSDALSSTTFSDSCSPQKKKEATTNQIRIKKTHTKEKYQALTNFSADHKVFMINTRQITAYEAMEHDEGTDTIEVPPKEVRDGQQKTP